MAAVNQRIATTAEVLLQVRDRVNAITTYPPEMEMPVASEVIIRNRVINIGVSGSLTEQTVKLVAEDIRRELIGRYGISQISISGVRDHEISIKLTEESLKRYGLSIQQVMDAVSHGSINLPAGTVRTKNVVISMMDGTSVITVRRTMILPAADNP